jgi:hypothetical protein
VAQHVVLEETAGGKDRQEKLLGERADGRVDAGADLGCTEGEEVWKGEGGGKGGRGMEGQTAAGDC